MQSAPMAQWTELPDNVIGADDRKLCLDYPVVPKPGIMNWIYSGIELNLN